LQDDLDTLLLGIVRVEKDIATIGCDRRFDVFLEDIDDLLRGSVEFVEVLYFLLFDFGRFNEGFVEDGSAVFYVALEERAQFERNLGQS
jgi:hypothetical protein